MSGLAACLLLHGAIAGAAAARPAVDLRDLAKQAVKSEQRFRSTPCSWDVSSPLADGGNGILSVLHTPDRELYIYAQQHGPQRQEICRIISRDGFWYVSGEKGLDKFRPFEMPAPDDLFYACLDVSRPTFVEDAADGHLGQLDTIEGNTAIFSTPLSVAQVDAIRNESKALEAFVNRSPALPNIAKIRSDVEQIRAGNERLIARGFPSHVQLSNALLVGRGNLWRVNDFKFLDSVDDSQFATAGRQWFDRAEDPTLGSLNDLAMATHLGPSRSGLEGRLVDVSIGRSRRIPFHGFLCLPVCFLEGRKSVVVFGVSFSSSFGQYRPYEINLSTGVNRAFPGHIFDSGYAHGGSISPDGKRLAFLHSGTASEILGNQIHILTLATGEIQAVGKPIETDNERVRWMPDGTGLLFTQIVTDGPGKSHTSLAVMDLTGRITTLRNGQFPLPLPDGRRLLFANPHGLWNTCNLDGSNAEIFADGLPGCLYPAVSPDGKRLVMSRRITGSLRLTLFPIGEGDGKVMTGADESWVDSIWR